MATTSSSHKIPHPNPPSRAVYKQPERAQHTPIPRASKNEHPCTQAQQQFHLSSPHSNSINFKKASSTGSIPYYPWGTISSDGSTKFTTSATIFPRSAVWIIQSPSFALETAALGDIMWAWCNISVPRPRYFGGFRMDNLYIHDSRIYISYNPGILLIPNTIMLYPFKG